MSVTFWMEQAPVERVQPYPEDEPDYFTIRPAAPFTEINLGNSNAIAFANMIDPQSVHYDEDSVNVYGEWDMDKLEDIQKRLMTLLNVQQKQEPLYLDPFISQEPGRCRVYSGGRDEDYVNRLATSMLEMVKIAREHQFPINFG